ncbi:Uncharacterized protein TSPI_07279 [Trichinella spiralis]|uniref:Integrase zinc-binding domain-containing protein n=1 Tax=Trichinella spiralis TaxID=6334 RepID=A0ABR3KJK4_TRISP
MAMSYIWWPRLDEDVELLAKTCTTCEVNQADPERYLVHPWVIPEKPWQRLHMDFCGPMFNRIWLVFIDAMTKWPGIVCFKNYPTEGMLNTQKIDGPVSSSNERRSRAFNEAMKKCSQLRQFHQEVQRFFLTYRTAQHLRTYASPSELLMSRKIQTQWDLLKPDTVKKEKTTGEKVDHQKNESYRLHDKTRRAFGRGTWTNSDDAMRKRKFPQSN